MRESQASPSLSLSEHNRSALEWEEIRIFAALHGIATEDQSDFLSSEAFGAISLSRPLRQGSSSATPRREPPQLQNAYRTLRTWQKVRGRGAGHTRPRLKTPA